MEAWKSLLELMDRLREPGGCPWDREQTIEDLKSYLLEEAYEVCEAIDSGRPEELREELGDLLFQVVFLSRIAKEKGEFDAEDVVREIVAKMIRRHPHVFSDARAENATEVLRQWEQIKKIEKGAPADASALDGVPRSLPALLRAQRLTLKAARVGFDWPGPAEVMTKIEEELGEVKEALAEGAPSSVAEEVGDLLFSMANFARHLGLEPESVLQQANQKFIRRFRRLETLLRESGNAAGASSADEMDRLWEQAKKDEKREERAQG